MQTDSLKPRSGLFRTLIINLALPALALLLLTPVLGAAHPVLAQTPDSATPSPDVTGEAPPTQVPPEPAQESPAADLQALDLPPLYLPLISRGYMPGPPETRLFCASLDQSMSIPDGDSVYGASDTFHIDDSRLVVDMDVYLEVEHSRVSDLGAAVVRLASGRSVWFLDRPGNTSGCQGDDIRAIFDDEANLDAEGRCNSWSPSLSGTFRPAQALSGFEGQPAAGDWRLSIFDYAGGETGKVVNWCLEVTLADVMPPAPEPFDPSGLPDEAYVSAISGQDQNYDLDCEIRSAVDWAGYFGYSIGEDDFLNGLPLSNHPDLGFVGPADGAYWGQTPPDPYGVHAGPIADRLNDYGVSAYAHRNLSWDVLRAEIAADRPVEVWFAGWSHNNLYPPYYPEYYTVDGLTTVVSPHEHTVLLIGYTPDQAYLLDGSMKYYLDLDEFLASWSSLRNMAILTHP